MVEAWAGVVVVGEPGGLDVVEEPAPLVVGDDQRGLAPCGRGGDGCGDLGQQRLSAVDVGMWVVVVGAALSFTQEGRVDVGEGGQRAGSGHGQEVGVGPGDRQVLLAP